MQQQMAMPAGAAAAAVPPAAGITTEQIQKVRFASLTLSLSLYLARVSGKDGSFGDCFGQRSDLFRARVDKY